MKKMPDSWRHEIKALTLEGGIHMPYSWIIGKIGSGFFIEFRDHCRIMGNRCPKCQSVWVPPRSRCPECFVVIDEKRWLGIGHTIFSLYG